MLREGDEAPDFELESDGPLKVAKATHASDTNYTLRMKDLRGQRVVLYFYPKDNTPGCTRQAIEFSAALKKFEKAGATVIGVSKDSIKSHCGFREKHGLKIVLASDPALAA